jgi:hypothetical protein
MSCDPLPLNGSVTEIVGTGVQLRRNRKKVGSASGWMLAALDLGVRHLPDRAGVAILVIYEWFLALDPAEEARLVRLPHPHPNDFKPSQILKDRVNKGLRGE